MLKKHLLISILCVGVSMLHYLTPVSAHHFHAIYQRLYYIPIILAAYYFSFRILLMYTAACGLLYAPHIFYQWSFDNHQTFTQYVEITMFLVIASLLGALFHTMRRQQTVIAVRGEQLAREKRLGLLGRLAAGLAHEIRNPLGGLLGSAEILREALGPGHPKQEFVDIIEAELRRVNGKLNEFLNFARPKPPDPIHNDINDIVRSITALQQKAASEAHVNIIHDLAEGIPLVPMDAEQVKQIVLNLLLNSLLSLKPEGTVTLSTRFENGQVLVTVRDDGPGIKHEDIDQIFEPFFTTRKSGTGLGLAISRQIAEQHGGALEAVPQTTGALFELRLPHEK